MFIVDSSNRFRATTTLTPTFAGACWLILGVTPAPAANSPPQTDSRATRLAVVNTTQVADLGQAILQSLTASPDGKHLAWVERSHGKFSVRWDDKKGAEFDKIGPLTFSANSNHLTYPAVRDGRQVVILDDRETPGYESTCPPFAFSQAGNQVAFLASEGNEEFVVKHGLERTSKGRVYSPQSILQDTIRLSPDGKRVAYVATGGQSQCIVADDVENQRYWGIQGDGPLFSSDGKHLAYVALPAEGATGLVIVDGQLRIKDERILSHGPQAQKDSVDLKHSLVFDPTGRKVACTVRRGDKKAVVVADGDQIEVGAMYDDIGSLAFTSHGHLVHVARDGDLGFIAVNRKESPRHPGRASAPVFSSDGKRTAYIIRNANNQSVILDGVKGNVYDRIAPSTLSFSADGSRFAYAAWQANSMVTVLHHQASVVESKVPYELTRLNFSPDPNGRHLAHIGVISRPEEGAKFMLVVDTITWEDADVLFIFPAQSLFVSAVTIELFGVKAGFLTKWLIAIQDP